MIEKTRIGVAGAAGAGKTTFANYLIDNFGFKLLGFATPLYELGAIHTKPSTEWVESLLEWTDEYLYPLGYDLLDRSQFVSNCIRVMKDVPVQEGKNRTLLQLLGTEVGRAWDENLWTNIFETKVEELGPDARIVNDNLRFPNEFDSLERLGFTTVFLETPSDIRAKRYEQEYGQPMNEAQLAHASEAYLDEIRNRSDFVYENTGNKERLEFFIRIVLSGELSKTGSVT